jgi:hypothetical protein
MARGDGRTGRDVAGDRRHVEHSEIVLGANGQALADLVVREEPTPGWGCRCLRPEHARCGSSGHLSANTYGQRLPMLRVFFERLKEFREIR